MDRCSTRVGLEYESTDGSVVPIVAVRSVPWRGDRGEGAVYDTELHPGVAWVLPGYLRRADVVAAKFYVVSELNSEETSMGEGTIHPCGDGLADISDENEKRFFWYPGDEGPPLDEAGLQNTIKAERFYYDPGEPIRFRVDSIEWHEAEPGPPALRKEESEDAKDPYEAAGYRIIAAVAEQGLGLVSWWGDDAGEEELEG